jgi:hypothetical protein
LTTRGDLPSLREYGTGRSQDAENTNRVRMSEHCGTTGCVAITLHPDRADTLRAADVDRRWIHHVDCATYAEDGQRADCDCGIPDLLHDLTALLLAARPTPSRVR